MRSPRCVEPLIAIDFVITDHAAYTIVENFRPATRKRIDTCGFELRKRLANAELRATSEERDLDHCERFQIYQRKPLFESGNKIEEVLKREIRMQSTYDVKLRHRFGIS